MDQDSKDYLNKRLNINIAIGGAVFILCMVMLIAIIRDKPKEKPAADPEVAKIVRAIGDSMIVEDHKRDVILATMEDSSKYRDNGIANQVKEIKMGITTYKKQSDEKISRIGTYNSADIISAYTDLERQYKTVSH